MISFTLLFAQVEQMTGILRPPLMTSESQRGGGAKGYRNVPEDGVEGQPKPAFKPDLTLITEKGGFNFIRYVPGIGRGGQ